MGVWKFKVLIFVKFDIDYKNKIYKNTFGFSKLFWHLYLMFYVYNTSFSF